MCIFDIVCMITNILLMFIPMHTYIYQNYIYIKYVNSYSYSIVYICVSSISRSMYKNIE